MSSAAVAARNHRIRLIVPKEGNRVLSHAIARFSSAADSEVWTANIQISHQLPTSESVIGDFLGVATYVARIGSTGTAVVEIEGEGAPTSAP